jgi:hypothetical protein
MIWLWKKFPTELLYLGIGRRTNQFSHCLGRGVQQGRTGTGADGGSIHRSFYSVKDDRCYVAFCKYAVLCWHHDGTSAQLTAPLGWFLNCIHFTQTQTRLATTTTTTAATQPTRLGRWRQQRPWREGVTAHLALYPFTTRTPTFKLINLANLSTQRRCRLFLSHFY